MEVVSHKQVHKNQQQIKYCKGTEVNLKYNRKEIWIAADVEEVGNVFSGTERNLTEMWVSISLIPELLFEWVFWATK